jgi:hypothetical protein
VTEPVARPSARRTVRVATALVAGQAALCAVIGWITFGATHGPARTASAPVDPLAGAPLVIPPPSVVPPVLPKTGPAVTAKATATSIDRTTAPRSRRTARHSSPPPPAAPPPVAPPPVAPLPAPTAPTTTSTDPPPSPPASDDSQLIVPTPTPTPQIQQPVVVREPCDPENALGKTAAGVALVCVHAADGTLRWQIS